MRAGTPTAHEISNLPNVGGAKAPKAQTRRVGPAKGKLATEADARAAMADLDAKKASLSPSAYATKKRRILGALRKLGVAPQPKPRMSGGKGLRMHFNPQTGELRVRHLADKEVSAYGYERVPYVACGRGDGDSTNEEREFTAALSTRKFVWIQLAKSGDFAGHSAGKFSLNAIVFNEIVRNFEATENKLIPFDYEHASEQEPTSGSIPTSGAPAPGWVKQLEIRGAGPTAQLWGLVEWGDQARNQIRSGEYKFLSPAIRFNSRDRVTGKPIGARLTSVALTNQPFLDGMMPVAAKDEKTVGADLAAPGTHDRVLLKFAHSSHEYMPKLRACLRMPELATATECMDAADRLSEMHALSGGAMVHGVDVGGYLKDMRDALGAPMGTTVEDIFDAVKALIQAAIEEHEAEMHPGMDDDDGAPEMEMAASDNDKTHPAGSPGPAALTPTTEPEGTTMTIATADGNVLTLTARVATQETEIAGLKLSVKDAEGKAETAEKLVTAKDAEIVALKAEAAKRDEAEQDRQVAEAFETYKGSKKLTDDDRAAMKITLKGDPALFAKLYPRIDAGKRHLLKNLTGGEESGLNGARALRDAPTETDDPIVEKPAPKAVTLRDLSFAIQRKLGCSLGDAQLMAVRQLSPKKKAG